MSRTHGQILHSNDKISVGYLLLCLLFAALLIAVVRQSNARLGACVQAGYANADTINGVWHCYRVEDSRYVITPLEYIGLFKWEVVDGE